MDESVDLDVVGDATGDGGVECGGLLKAFVDAVMSVDSELILSARTLLIERLGLDGVVDAAAVVAMFQLNTRAADAAGISVEERTVPSRAAIGERLGFIDREDGLAP